MSMPIRLADGESPADNQLTRGSAVEYRQLESEVEALRKRLSQLS